MARTLAFLVPALLFAVLLVGMRAALNERKTLALRLNSVPAPGRAVVRERPLPAQSPVR